MNKKIKVNVIDTKTNKIVLEGKTMNQVAMHFDMSYTGVQNAVKRKTKIQSRYLVMQTEVFVFTNKVKVNKTYPDNFEERWDKYRFLVNPNARR